MGRPGHNCHMIAPQGSTLSAQQDSQDGEGSECPSTRGIIWINRLEKTNPGKGTSSGRAPHVNKTIFNEPPEAVARTKTTMYPPAIWKEPSASGVVCWSALSSSPWCCASWGQTATWLWRELVNEWEVGQRWSPSALSTLKAKRSEAKRNGGTTVKVSKTIVVCRSSILDE